MLPAGPDLASSFVGNSGSSLACICIPPVSVSSFMEMSFYLGVLFHSALTCNDAGHMGLHILYCYSMGSSQVPPSCKDVYFPCMSHSQVPGVNEDFNIFLRRPNATPNRHEEQEGSLLLRVIGLSCVLR